MKTAKILPPADMLIGAWSCHGYDGDDLRDGAHEVHHALDAGVQRDWGDREAIHAALMRKARGRRSTMLRYEIDARAVEHVVCRAYGVDHDIKHWAFWACMEGVKSGFPMGSFNQFAAAVSDAVDTDRIVKAAARVVLIGCPASTTATDVITALRSAAAAVREGK